MILAFAVSTPTVYSSPPPTAKMSGLRSTKYLWSG
jgi:hypothetical protein